MYCDVFDTSAPKLGGAQLRSLVKFREEAPLYDAVLVWNEPEFLQFAAPAAIKICAQQLNDFSYCKDFSFVKCVDAFVFPSRQHRDHIVANCPIDIKKTTIIPNSVNPEFLREGARDLNKLVYISSPDRGLHHLLRFFPQIRAAIPAVTLDIYYDYAQWEVITRKLPDEVGRRARYMRECFDRLGRRGENGISLVGNRSNTQIARALGEASMLCYPCDPIAFTEGFSVATLDACAAGCIPVLSAADALPEIYSGIATIIPGNPSVEEHQWLATVIALLKRASSLADWRVRCQGFSRAFYRQTVSESWDGLLGR